MKKLNPFEMTLECPPDSSHPFTYDTDIRVEASYYLNRSGSSEDGSDEIRPDKVIRVSDNSVIEISSLTEEQREAIELEALERVEEAIGIADNAAADGIGDGDEREQLPDYTD